MTTAVAAALAVVAAPAVALGCSRAERDERGAIPRHAPPSVPGVRPDAAPAGGSSGPLVLARGVRVVRAGAGSDASQIIREQRDAARRDGRDLVVYVGAKWCEPCRLFHKAAQDGQLDADLPDLTLLEFDLDEDNERLASAGYVSQYIPLFALPGPDGRATEKRFEGAVKGSGAVPSILGRLRSLLRNQ